MSIAQGHKILINPHTIKAMSLIHELSQTTAQARRDEAERKRLYDLETERLVQALVDIVKEPFTEACREATRNQKNHCCIGVHLSDEVKTRNGAKDVTEQKLWAMLVELGFHDGTVLDHGSCFQLTAAWPVADATSSMSFIHQLSQTTAQARRDKAERKRLYDLETERLVQPFVATVKEEFMEACQQAARNQKNSCDMQVHLSHLSDEIKNRDGAKDVTEQKLWTMLAELGLHDGTVVEQPDPFSIDMYDFLVRATWPVADAASPKEASPERGTSITCPICHEHRPAEHISAMKLQTHENLQLCNSDGGVQIPVPPKEQCCLRGRDDRHVASFLLFIRSVDSRRVRSYLPWLHGDLWDWWTSAVDMSGALCRCICGTGNQKDQFELQPAFPTSEFGVPEAAPAEAVMDSWDNAALQRLDAAMSPPGGLSFSTLQQPLRGTPIREGNLWYLSAEDQVDAVHFSLYVNGFFFRHEGVEVSISLSPFVLVRNCKFQSGYNATLTDVKIFKISLFAHSACYYFGVRSEDERWAEEERSRWVLDVSRAIRLVTQSLFPPFHISCEPLQGAPHTRRRLMAGYVVHHEDVSTASVVYFELQAHEKGAARMLLYENSKCQVVVGEIPLHESAMCSEKIGINCSCFSVEDFQFSTRTLAERKLWLRAISNVRVAA
eukprot:symbB.v1.2.034405.t1/scaffold4434.1/size39729/3